MNFRHHIFVCTNERPDKKSCRGGELQKLFKDTLTRYGVPGNSVRANKAGCLDQCSNGSVVVIYPEGVWYGHVTENDVDEIVRSHICEGIPVERLRIDRPRGR